MARHTPRDIPLVQQRKASLFRNGRSQAVRIPKEFEFAEGAVTIRKERGSLVIEPILPRSSLATWLATLEPLEDSDCMPIVEGYPAEPVYL